MDNLKLLDYLNVYIFSGSQEVKIKTINKIIANIDSQPFGNIAYQYYDYSFFVSRFIDSVNSNNVNDCVKYLLYMLVDCDIGLSKFLTINNINDERRCYISGYILNRTDCCKNWVKNNIGNKYIYDKKYKSKDIKNYNHLNNYNNDQFSFILYAMNINKMGMMGML